MVSARSVPTLTWLCAELSQFRHKNARFALAIAAVIAALTITACTQLIFGSLAALIFAAAVIASTYFFGLVAGLCTVVLAVLVLDFFYIPPVFALNLDISTLRMAIGLLAFAAASHFAKQKIFARAPIIDVDIPPPVQGHFDGIQDGRVYGWAVDPHHPSRPVFLSVLVNGDPVACTAAVHFRPDVADSQPDATKHAFYSDLGFLFPIETEAVVDVQLPSGKSLPGAPRVLRITPQSRPQCPTVLFMHIPKTAGTAFREGIAANYDHAEIAYLYPTIPGLLVKDLRDLPVEQRRSFRIVIGHFQFGMHAALPQQCEYVTIVREPTARIVSHFAYLHKAQPELVNKDGRPISPQRFFEDRLSVDFDNAMVRCFSGVDQRVFPPGTLTRDIFDWAVHNLRTAFTFVGHQETSASSFATLQDRFGWHATKGLGIVNAGDVHVFLKTSPDLLKVIRRYNHWDYLLYEEILRIFPRN